MRLQNRGFRQKHSTEFELRAGKHRCPTCGGAVAAWPVGHDCCFLCVIRVTKASRRAAEDDSEPPACGIAGWGRRFEEQIRAARKAGEGLQ